MLELYGEDPKTVNVYWIHLNVQNFRENSF